MSESRIAQLAAIGYQISLKRGKKTRGLRIGWSDIADDVRARRAMQYLNKIAAEAQQGGHNVRGWG